MNIKVRKTKNLDRRIVTRGKLVLVPCDSNQINNIRTISFKDTYEKPIIISETENIATNDMVLLPDMFIKTMTDSDMLDYLSSESTTTKKILALPEHFSPEILKMIINEDLKDGQDLWIECEEPRVIARFNPTFEGEYFVKLTDNHINIFPIQQNPQLEKALDIYIKEKHTQEECIGFIDGFEKGTISKEQFKPLFDQMMSFIDNKIAKNNFNQYFKEL